MLVLALIMSSFVITTGAASSVSTDTPVVDKDVALFSPSAQYTTVTKSNASTVFNKLLASDDTVNGGDKTSFGFNNIYGSGNLDTYLVEADGEEPYVMFVPTADAASSHMLKGHSYVHMNTNELITYDEDNPTYFVWEIDFATESTFLPFYFQIVTRTEDTGSGLWSKQLKSYDMPLFLETKPGEFHHLSLIGDVNENTMYIFVDNKLVHKFTDQAVMSNDGFASYKAGTTVNLEGMRFQIPNNKSSEGKLTEFINENQSFCMKNIYTTVLTGTESGNLKDVIDGNITSWTGNRTSLHEYSSLPALVEINGTEYTNLIDAEKALNTFRRGNVVNALRSCYSGILTVNSDAVINTFTTDFLVEGTDEVTVTKTGGGTWIATVNEDIEKHSLSQVEANPSNIKNYVLLDRDDNMLTSLENNPDKVKSVNGHIVETLNGNKYLLTYDASEDAMPEDNHYYVSCDFEDVNLGGYRYIVFDYDVYSESEFPSFYVKFMTSNSPKDVHINPETLSVPLVPGKWNHITLVGDTTKAGNVSVYVDGKLSFIQSSALYPTSTIASNVTLSAVRVNQIAGSDESGRSLTRQMSLASDNYCLRYITADRANGLTLGAETLDGWADRIDNPNEELPAIATVDGIDYYDTGSLSKALTADHNAPSFDAYCKDVQFYRNFLGTVIVDTRATITWNGLTLGGVEYADEVTVSGYNRINGTTAHGVTEVYKENSSLRTDTEINSGNYEANKDALNTALKAPEKNYSTLDSSYWFVGTHDPANSYYYAGISNLEKGLTIHNTTVNGQNDSSVGIPANGGSLDVYINDKNHSYASNIGGKTVSATKIKDNSDYWQYILLEFDIAYVGYIPGNDYSVSISTWQLEQEKTGTTTTTTMKEYTYTFDLSKALENSTSGEFTHITIFIKPANNENHKHSCLGYVYVNDTCVGSASAVYRATGVSGPWTEQSSTGETTYTYSYYVEKAVFNSSESTDVLYDNVYFDVLNLRKRDVDNAFKVGLTLEGYPLHSIQDDYVMPKFGTPLLASVAGELYYVGEEDKIAEVLNSFHYDPVFVQFYRVPVTPIEFSETNVTLDTNGLAEKDSNGVLDTSAFFKVTNCTATQVGTSTVEFVSTTFQPNQTTELITDTSKILEVIKRPADDNILSSVGLNKYNSADTDGQRATYLRTNTVTGGVHIYDALYNVNELPDSETDTFFNWNTLGVCYKKNANQYIVIDFDAAIYSDSLPVEFYVVSHKSSDNISSSNEKIDLVKEFKAAGVDLGHLAHITMVVSPDKNSVYVFINDKLTSESALFDDSNYVEGSTYFNALRGCHNNGGAIGYDNVYIRSITDANISSGENFASSEYDIFDENYYLPTLTTLALVDGEHCTTVKQVENAIADGKNHTIEFLHVPFRPVQITAACKVETNGLGNDDNSNLFTLPANMVVSGITTSAGYSNIVSIVEKVEYAPLTITVDTDGIANTVYEGEIKVGTHIENFLADNGILCSSIVVAGNIYKSTVWDNGAAPEGEVKSTDALVFRGTASKATGDFVLLTTAGEVKEINIEEGNEDAAYNAVWDELYVSGDSTVALNADLEVRKEVSMARTGTKNIYMNGHTISQNTAEAMHCLHFHGNADINFYGAGSFRALQHSATNAMLYLDYDYSGTVHLDHVDVQSSMTVAEIRGGSVTFLNSDIQSYRTNVSSGVVGTFKLGEDYSSSRSYNPMSLSILGSNVSLRYPNVVNRYQDATIDVPLITHTITTTVDANGIGGVDPETTVIIHESTVYSQGSLVRANLTRDNASAYDKSNMTVYVNNSTLIAKKITNYDLKVGSVIFYDNVKTNLGKDHVSFPQNLAHAYTNDGLAPNYYTSNDYYTVEWSTGDTQLWANGAIPTYDGAKFDDIRDVLPGSANLGQSSYKFKKTAEEAPFNLLVNITLADYIGFNLYIPTSANPVAVYLDGQLVESHIQHNVQSAGLCNTYTIRMAPQVAAKEFSVVVVLADGTVLNRTLSVGTYADTLWTRIEQNPTDDYYKSIKEETRALLSGTLNYIEQAAIYSGITVNMDKISNVLTRVGLSNSDLEDAGFDTAYETDSMKDYITSAQINVRDKCTFRFNIVSGRDASKFTFKISGTETELKDVICNADSGYVELSRRAYDMAKPIDIYYDGEVIGTYNLYTYYTIILKQIASTDGSGDIVLTNGKATITKTTPMHYEIEAACKLIKTLWIYSTLVDQYVNAAS